MSVVHREVEKKYAADESFELPPLAELVAGSAEGRDSPAAEDRDALTYGIRWSITGGGSGGRHGVPDLGADGVG